MSINILKFKNDSCTLTEQGNKPLQVVLRASDMHARAVAINSAFQAMLIITMAGALVFIVTGLPLSCVLVGVIASILGQAAAHQWACYHSRKKFDQARQAFMQTAEKHGWIVDERSPRR